MNCSVEQYIDLCRLVISEQKMMQQKITILSIHKLLNLRSTSIIQVNNNTTYGNDTLGQKVIYYDNLERDISVSKKIIELMESTTELIDPSYSVHVAMTYMMTDKKGNRRFAKQEAERFDYDRRTFKKNMDQAIEDALKKPETKVLLNQIKQIAKINDRQEYLNILK